MITAGTGSNGLAIVIDSRSADDQTNDTVLEGRPWLYKYLGKGEVAKALKVAFREPGEDLWKADEIKAARDEFWVLMKQLDIRSIVTISGTRPPKSNQKPGREAWAIVTGRPGSSYSWTGTVSTINNTYVIPLLPPWQYEPVYSYLTQRWLKMALALAQGKMKPYTWPKMVTEAGPELLKSLKTLLSGSGPLGIDIETTMDKTKLTAIGIADEKLAVSIPWDDFWTCDGQFEPGSTQVIKELTLELLASPRAKIMQNGAFERVQFDRRGIKLGGEFEDTMLLHRVAFPQFPHDLQFVASSLMCIDPWKSEFKPPRLPKGRTKKDYDIYTFNPPSMRLYNAKDTAIMLPLYDILKKKVGV